MDVRIEAARLPLVDELPFEVVERKGRGHPDSLCDAIAETASRRYTEFFLSTYGRRAHHWFDKVMLVGGKARLDYSRGDLVTPYEVIFTGKAVKSVGAQDVPVLDILRGATADVLSALLRNFDVERDLLVTDRIADSQGPINAKSRYTPQSVADLVPEGGRRVSNDCNVCSGFAPLSALEAAVLNLERYLTSPGYLAEHPHTGVDVKVVGIRRRDSADIVINIPLISAEVTSYADYEGKVAGVREDALRWLADASEFRAAVTVNPQDVSRLPYLTVTGTVADTGDIGVVGRGNRINGLITPMRPMSIEAANGKNPVDHTGKLYGVLSQQIADHLHEKFGVKNQTHMVTFKERPVTDPYEVVVYIHGRGAVPAESDLVDTVRAEVMAADQLTARFADPDLEMW